MCCVAHCRLFVKVLVRDISLKVMVYKLVLLILISINYLLYDSVTVCH